MAAIAENQSGEENFFCGSTLIGSKWVWTASHCSFSLNDETVPLTEDDIVIVLGEHNKEDDNESKIPRKTVGVSKIIRHQNYSTEDSSNDIALFKLKEEVDLNVYTPACLPEIGQSFVGAKAWVYGEIDKKDNKRGLSWGCNLGD